MRRLLKWLAWILAGLITLFAAALALLAFGGGKPARARRCLAI